MSAKHEFDPTAELFHFDFLKQDQLAFLRKTTHLTGNELQLMAYKQALIIFNTLTFPQNVRSMQHEEDRRDEVLGAWEIRNGTAYAEGFSTIEQIYENTRLYKPELYNAAEAKTVIAGFHLLAQGDAQEIHYPMFHPDSTRYIVGLRRVGDTIVNISVDVGKFGRDLTHTEGADVVRLLGQKEGTLLHAESDFPLLVVDKQLTTTQIQQTALSRSLISDVDQSRKHTSVFQRGHVEIGQTSISTSVPMAQPEKIYNEQREGRIGVSMRQPLIESARQPQSIVAKVAAETAHGFMQAYTWLREARQENKKKRAEDSTVVYAETSVRVTRLTVKPGFKEKISNSVKRAKDHVKIFINAIQKTKDSLFPQLNKTRMVETTAFYKKIKIIEKPYIQKTTVQKHIQHIGELLRKPFTKAIKQEALLHSYLHEKHIVHGVKTQGKPAERAGRWGQKFEKKAKELVTKTLRLSLPLKESIKEAYQKIRESMPMLIFRRVELLIVQLISMPERKKFSLKQKESIGLRFLFDQGIKRLTMNLSLMNRDIRLTTFNKVKYGEKPKKAVIKKAYPHFRSLFFFIKKSTETLNRFIMRVYREAKVNKQVVPSFFQKKLHESKRNMSKHDAQLWLLVWLWFVNAFEVKFERPVWFFKPKNHKKKQGIVYDQRHNETRGSVIVGSASPVVS